jgi:hypothetical protein
LIITPNDRRRLLALPAGTYSITVRDAAGTVLSDTSVAVPER